MGRDGIIIKQGAVGEQDVILSSWLHNSTSWVNPVPPVGKGRVWEEKDKLHFEGRVWLDDPEGKKAWRILDEFEWLDWSITFNAEERPESKYDSVEDEFVVIFSSLRVFEASPVPVGGSFGTGTEELRAQARSSWETERKAEDQALLDTIQRSRDAALLESINRHRE